MLTNLKGKGFYSSIANEVTDKLEHQEVLVLLYEM